MLNDVDPDTAGYYYHHYYYSQHEGDGKGRGRKRGRAAKLPESQKDDSDGASRVVMVYPDRKNPNSHEIANIPEPPSKPLVEGVPLPPEYRAYCVKCRTKREFRGEMMQMSGDRFGVEGKCPVCATRIVRMLGRT